jgi:CRISPR/Cas system-associated exonuclease Cas4 (RecB family)
MVALAEYVRAVELGVYPLSMTGENCTYCPFRDACAGVPVPDEDHGRP